MLSSKEIAFIAIFGAMAAVITTLVSPIPIFSFPILPFLRFDLAEVIDFTAFLIVGPLGGLLVAFVHFIALVLIPPYGQVPIASEAMKFFAVSSTMVGFLLITRTKSLLLGILGAVLGRVLIMALANYLFFFVFFPFTLPRTISLISKFLGIPIEGFGAELLFLLLVTGIFNLIHALITSLIPLTILRYSPQIITLASSLRPVWIVRYFKK